MSILNIISMVGGLALFLYGMQVMGDGLKAGSSGAMKNALAEVTNNPVKSFLLGLLVTSVIQSSTATIVLTSGLVGAGMMTLHQSVGIIVGANVGTTMTGQIIRLLDVETVDGATSILSFFKPDTLAPLASVIGLILLKISSNKNYETAGNVSIGFGILFTGLLSMTAAVAPLSSSPVFQGWMVRFSDNPVLGFLVGFAVAFVLQSSSATVGILQAISMTGTLVYSAVYPMILGIYLGDAVTTAIVCSIGAKADAKRTGVIHVCLNISQEILIFVAMFILYELGMLDNVWNSVMTPGSIANLHTSFKLICAVVLLPLSNTYERLSLKIVPDDEQLGENIDKELELLNEKFFTSPALALESAKTAAARMLELAGANTLNAMEVLKHYDAKEIARINENETHIDNLSDAVNNYLVRLSPYISCPRDNDMLNYYLQCSSEFERIGDYAVHLAESAQELVDKKRAFTEIAQGELEVARAGLNEILDLSYYTFTQLDFSRAKQIEPTEEVMDDITAILKNNHTQRLRGGLCSTTAGLIFLDCLVNIEAISDKCSNIGIFTLALVDDKVMMSHHDYLKMLHSGEDPDYNSTYTQLHDKYHEMLREAYAPYSGDSIINTEA